MTDGEDRRTGERNEGETNRPVSRAEFLETMEGCIDDETRRDDAPSLSPAALKADWTSDLPDEP